MEHKLEKRPKMNASSSLKKPLLTTEVKGEGDTPLKNVARWLLDNQIGNYPLQSKYMAIDLRLTCMLRFN
jgi:hypothetical protein